MVCPHNSRSSGRLITIGALQIPEFLDLIDLFALDEDAFTDRYQQTPLARTKRKGLLRNAAIVLGNQRFSPALPVLKRSLFEESDPGLIDACRWAIREIESPEQDRSKGGAQ
jgi:epoxyqueuosine reductase